jgi:uncharacterized membrane protein YphA (DoxX/SURF4 family)
MREQVKIARFQRQIYWLRVAIRMFLALVFLTYSIAKLLGTQFIDSGPTLEKPVGELSGFELTWVYFGYSKLFSWFIAGGQLTAAILLLFDRTARLGATVLLPITTNIVIVNFAFNISSDTKVVSVIYLILNVILILSEWRSWWRFFIVEPGENDARPAFFRRAFWVPVKVLLFVFVGCAIWLGLDALQKKINPPSPLDGDWHVVSRSLDDKLVGFIADQPWWERVFFDGQSFSIRTDRGMIWGKLRIPDVGRFEIQYLPLITPRAPVAYHRASPSQPSAVSPPEDGHALSESRVAEEPVVFVGSSRYEGTHLILDGKVGEQRFQLVLEPLVREKH